MIKKKFVLKFTLLVFLFMVTGTLFAQQNALVERYLNAANREYTAKNYAKAYSYMNYVLDEYTADAMPQNVEILAESVYYSYLSNIKDTSNFDEFIVVKEKLIEYPNLSSDRISRIVKTMNSMITQEASSGEAPSSGTSVQRATPVVTSSDEAQKTSQALAQTLQKQQELLEKEKIEKQALLEKANAEKQEILDAYQESINTQRIVSEVISKSAEKTSETTIMIIIAVGIVLLIVIIIVIIVVSINLKNSKKQQEQFEATLKVVSQMARVPNERILINGLPDIYERSARPIGSSSLNSALPEPELTDEERQEVKDLASKCEKLGAEIDKVTGRKNNSKNVSEMVFKISHEMGVSTNTAMLYFCAAMVYDAGFLLVDTNLLAAESLTEEQKYEIRGHVKKGIEQISFIPERYHNIFADAVLKHHENMDGSGYPDGLFGDQIPMIARLIHVVETFISLISRRNYRTIFDKESAIAELRKHPEQYDESIVDILDSLV